MTSVSQRPAVRAALPRVGRFMTVGMIGTIIDFGLFTALHMLLGVPTLVANTTSYSAGIINNFIWHRQWTFAGRSPKVIGVQFIQFAAVSLSALAMNNLIVLWLTPQLSYLLSSPTYGVISAKICATAVGLGWSFLANNFWTFRGATKK